MPGAETFVRLIVEGVLESGWDWLTIDFGEEGKSVATYTGDYTLAKLTVSWKRLPTVGVAQDVDQCTFHFLNLTGGEPDDTWTAADFIQVEDLVHDWWDPLKTFYTPEIQLSEYSWRYDGPGFRPHGSGFSPTIRSIPQSVSGTASSGTQLPPQCAVSVTEVTESKYTAYGVGVPGDTPGTGRTQLRNRWGRIFLPAPSHGMLLHGRFDAGFCASVSLRTSQLYNGLVAADIIPVMYSPTTGNAWSITELHVDDIVDVIRSRRFIEPLTRAVNAIDSP